MFSGVEGDAASLHSLHHFTNHTFISYLEKWILVSLIFEEA